MDKKELRKERLKIYGLVVFLVALFGLAIGCAIYAVILVGKYGSMPIEEVPLWVWWFIS